MQPDIQWSTVYVKTLQDLNFVAIFMYDPDKTSSMIVTGVSRVSGVSWLSDKSIN